MAKPAESSQSAPPPNSVQQAAQREIQKFKGMQERRQQLVSELQALDMQLNKTQGALEVFQAMGIIKAGM
jgi:chaperonin cofactor prefoldin